MAIKSCGKEQQMTLHLKKRMVEENPTALRLPGGVLGGLHVGQLDEHLVQHIKMVRKKNISANLRNTVFNDPVTTISTDMISSFVLSPILYVLSHFQKVM